MARVELAPEVFDDFGRFLDHMAQFDVENAPARIAEIVRAIQILTHSSLVGRSVKNCRRELVIGPDSRGYVALYRFEATVDTVFVPAIRSQREADHQFKR
jgi:toxin ParE1/3/4